MLARNFGLRTEKSQVNFLLVTETVRHKPQESLVAVSHLQKDPVHSARKKDSKLQGGGRQGVLMVPIVPRFSLFL